MYRRLVLGDVIDTVRNDLSSAGTGEIVIVDDSRFDRVGHPVAMEIPQHFLLFRVDADHRMPGAEILFFQCGDPFKLGVAIGMLSHRSFFLRLAASIPVFPQQT